MGTSQRIRRRAERQDQAAVQVALTNYATLALAEIEAGTAHHDAPVWQPTKLELTDPQGAAQVLVLFDATTKRWLSVLSDPLTVLPHHSCAEAIDAAERTAWEQLPHRHLNWTVQRYGLFEGGELVPQFSIEPRDGRWGITTDEDLSTTRTQPSAHRDFIFTMMVADKIALQKGWVRRDPRPFDVTTLPRYRTLAAILGEP